MEFQRIFSNAPWEEKVGYCRVLKADKHIYITGTAPIDEKGTTFAPGDAYKQTKRCLEIIQDSLLKLNVPINKIVRTRMYVTNIQLWQDYGKAHKEFFQKHPPATTMVQVAALISPDMLIEIEADAVI
ncbi:MAG: RidA family protein [Oligoflexia bacterium]|nr:RidA family protein [Oligoflexia bacterium]